MRIAEVEAALADGPVEYATKNGTRVRVLGVDVTERSARYSWQESTKRRMARYVQLDKETGEINQATRMTPRYVPLTKEEQAEEDAKNPDAAGKPWARTTRTEYDDTGKPLYIEARDLILTWEQHEENNRAFDERQAADRAACARLAAAWAALGGGPIDVNLRGFRDVVVVTVNGVDGANALAERLEGVGR